MVELNKRKFAHIVKKYILSKKSYREAAKEIGIDHMIIFRAANEKEIGLDKFLKIIHYIRFKCPVDEIDIWMTYDELFEEILLKVNVNG